MELSFVAFFLDVRFISDCLGENIFVCTYTCTLSVSLTIGKKAEVKVGRLWNTRERCCSHMETINVMTIAAGLLQYVAAHCIEKIRLYLY